MAPTMAIPLPPAQVLPSQTPIQNWLSSNLAYSVLITSHHGPPGKHGSSVIAFMSCCGNVFNELLPRNGPGICAHLAVATQRWLSTLYDKRCGYKITGLRALVGAGSKWKVINLEPSQSNKTGFASELCLIVTMLCCSAGFVTRMKLEQRVNLEFLVKLIKKTPT
jgi:hypothetical protein